MNRGSPRVRIVGIGNKYRGDDGAGLAVAQCLRGKLPSGITIIEETGEGTSLLETWKAADFIILVDAIQSGSSPGAIRRMDLSKEKLPREIFSHSSHAFGIAAAIHLARALNELPRSLVLYGIEGRNFAANDTFSPEVKKAISTCAAQIQAEVEMARGQGTSPSNRKSRRGNRFRPKSSKRRNQ